MVRVTVRPIASALPLGCFAFGVGNVLLAAFSLHWLPLAESSLVAFILLAFVAPLELIPCILAYLARDTGGATAMGIFSMAWIVQAIELLRSPTQPPSPTAGLFLALLALCLAVLTAASLPGKPLLGILLGIALLRSVAAATVAFRRPRPRPHRRFSRPPPRRLRLLQRPRLPARGRPWHSPCHDLPPRRRQGRHGGQHATPDRTPLHRGRRPPTALKGRQQL